MSEQGLIECAVTEYDQLRQLEADAEYDRAEELYELGAYEPMAAGARE